MGKIHIAEPFPREDNSHSVAVPGVQAESRSYIEEVSNDSSQSPKWV